MHFEHKHQYFKNIVSKAKNFVNITKMLSERHQLFQASLNNDRYRLEIICDKAELLVQGMFDNFYCKNFKYVSKRIQICGIEYMEDDCLISNINENEHIEVLQIKSIFLEENYKNVTFYGRCYLMFYNYLQGVYEISNENVNYKSVSYLKLISTLPSRFFTANNKILLSLPYSVCKCE